MAFGGAFLGLHASLTILSKLLDMAGGLNPLTQTQRYGAVAGGLFGSVHEDTDRAGVASVTKRLGIAKVGRVVVAYTRRMLGFKVWVGPGRRMGVPGWVARRLAAEVACGYHRVSGVRGCTVYLGW